MGFHDCQQQTRSRRREPDDGAESRKVSGDGVRLLPGSAVAVQPPGHHLPHISHCANEVNSRSPIKGTGGKKVLGPERELRETGPQSALRMQEMACSSQSPCMLWLRTSCPVFFPFYSAQQAYNFMAKALTQQSSKGMLWVKSGFRQDRKMTQNITSIDNDIYVTSKHPFYSRIGNQF